MINDFNILATTARGNESAMVNEILYLLKEELGDIEAKASKTKIRGLIVAKTNLDPYKAIETFRIILFERPYELRYALRILPIERIVSTDLGEIKLAATELASKIGETETFRVTVEKRFTTLHSREIIETIAGNINRKVDLKNPDKILLVEILGSLTGISLLTHADIISVIKEKML